MRLRLPLAVLLAVLASLSAAFASDGGTFKQVKPKIFDPHHTFLVQSTWLTGIGCPTHATTVDFNSVPPFDLLPPADLTDPACLTGDSKDKRNQGLLLAKTGHTLNDAAATARLEDIPAHITELGYDLRKPRSFLDASGSHCGAGAPRFNVYTKVGNTTTIHFVGCSSPPPNTQTVGTGWLRLRWDPATAFPPIAPTDNVTRIDIVFDEGQNDTAPDNFGLAVLDNIDLNGKLVGQGPASDDERDRPEKKDKKND